MTHVLVAVASRYGATFEIAEAIGATLADTGLDVAVRRAEDVEGLGGYDAAILGSAVYMGRWLEPARALAEDRRDELGSRPVWLFSSGPIGDPPRPSEESAVQIDDLLESTRAREHRLFAGKLDRRRMRFADRAVVAAFRAPDGDFRDWDEIGSWAIAIAGELSRSS